MPRKALVPVEDITKIIIGHKTEIVDDERGTIATTTNDVWEKISKETNHLMSSKYVYTLVKTNRYNLQEKLGVLQSKDQFLHHSDTSSSSSNEGASNLESINVNITLSVQEWNRIAPREVIYSCSDPTNPSRLVRPYEILASGWTQVVNEHFWEITRLPCTLSFKRCKITPTGNTYARMEGSCTECQAMFVGEINCQPKPNTRVHINGVFTGSFRKRHFGLSKRLLSGTALETALRKMGDEKMSASMFRRTEAERIMELGDVEPSHLPSLNVLRVAKSRWETEKRIDKNPLLAVLKLKYSAEYHSVIKDVGLDRFFVHYWTPSQIQVYASYCKSCEYPKIHIDATGSVVARLERPFNNKSGHLFLYEVTLLDDETNMQYSVCNMLSERHDNNSIYYWLCQWKRDGAPAPREAICDHSLALISAIVRAFTDHSSLLLYLQKCYTLLTTSSNDLPQCYIRCDVAHTMKIIASWTVLRKPFCDQRNRTFYIRILAQILQSTDFDDVKVLLRSLFCVAYSQTEGIDHTSGRTTICETEKIKLQKRIAYGHTDATIETSISDVLEPTELCNENACIDTSRQDLNSKRDAAGEKSFTAVAQNIANQCKLEVSLEKGDHDNHQHLPEIVPMIIQLCRLLPLWASVMVPIFGYGNKIASSAPVESSFNDLKTRVFAHKKLPLRLDEFLPIHIKSLEGTMKLVAAAALRKQVDAESSPGPQVLYNRSQEQPIPDKESNVEDVRCIACNNGDFPTGAHRCMLCYKAIHIFSGCSLPVQITENDEGYGQKRICLQCALNPKQSCPKSTISSFEAERTVVEKEPCIACQNGDSPTGEFFVIGESISSVDARCQFKKGRNTMKGMGKSVFVYNVRAKSRNFRKHLQGQQKKTMICSQRKRALWKTGEVLPFL